MAKGQNKPGFWFLVAGEKKPGFFWWGSGELMAKGQNKPGFCLLGVRNWQNFFLETVDSCAGLCYLIIMGIRAGI